jgi:ParB family chromosome partitioning protein
MTSRSASDDGESGARKAERASAATDVSQAVQELQELPVQLIDPNPSQPRQRFDETALHALAGSIRKRGVSAAGACASSSWWEISERRGRAALVCGSDRGPGEIPALVCHYDDAATLEVALIENMARENLSLLEEARACETLVQLGLTHRQIGDRVGRSGSAVANLRRLLNLSAEILQFIERGELGRGPWTGAAGGE